MVDLRVLDNSSKGCHNHERFTVLGSVDAGSSWHVIVRNSKRRDDASGCTNHLRGPFSDIRGRMDQAVGPGGVVSEGGGTIKRGELRDGSFLASYIPRI
jgi:hypothetical protein